MSTTEPKAEQSRREVMQAIEEKYLGRCIDQAWGNGRRHLIELMEIRGTSRKAVVVKQFERSVPRGYSRDWPELAGAWVYVEVDPDNNTWDGLDRALAEHVARVRKD
jgi:hypothetical protein